MQLQNFYAQDANGNIVPGAACTLYLPGSTTLASGLVDVNGDPLPNPFSANGDGLAQFAAPNGEYDLKIEAGLITSTLPVVFADTLQALQQLGGFLPPSATAPIARVDGTPLQPGDNYFNTADGVQYIYIYSTWTANNVNGADLANQSDPAKGAALVGYDNKTVADFLMYSATFASYEEIEAYAGLATGCSIQAPGIYGTFRRVSGTMTPVKGMVIKDALDRYWVRDILVDVYVSWFGAAADDVTDDTPAFNAMLEYCRANRLVGRAEAKKYYIPGEINISGSTFHGVIKGFESREGTILRGNGTNRVLVQAQTNLGNVTYDIYGIRIENAGTGIALSYSVHAKVSETWVVDSVNGMEVGQAGVIGPLWCNFLNVHVRVTGLALNVQGTDFSNANYFRSCTFYSTGPITAQMGTTGGFGALANIFINSEFHGKGIGLVLMRTGSTSFVGCFFESEGPGLCLNGNSLSVHMDNPTWGTLKNTNASGKPGFIWHQGGTASITSTSGTIFLNAGAEYNNLRHFVSDAPELLTINMMVQPSRQIASTGFMTFGDGLPTARCNVNHQGSWTPLFSAAGGGADLGNGTLTGSYTLSGRAGLAEITFMPGSTTLFGTGAFQFTGPFAERSSTPERALGNARLTDNGVGFFLALAEMVSGSNLISLYTNGSNVQVGATSPFPWANGDSLRMSIPFELNT